VSNLEGLAAEVQDVLHAGEGGGGWPRVVEALNHVFFQKHDFRIASDLTEFPQVLTCCSVLQCLLQRVAVCCGVCCVLLCVAVC